MTTIELEKAEPEALEMMKARGGNWAAYQNHDLGDLNVGHMQFMRVGEGCTYKEPPSKHPNSWRYIYVGMVDMETGEVKKP